MSANGYFERVEMYRVNWAIQRVIAYNLRFVWRYDDATLLLTIFKNIQKQPTRQHIPKFQKKKKNQTFPNSTSTDARRWRKGVGVSARISKTQRHTRSRLILELHLDDLRRCNRIWHSPRSQQPEHDAQLSTATWSRTLPGRATAIRGNAFTISMSGHGTAICEIVAERAIIRTSKRTGPNSTKDGFWLRGGKSARREVVRSRRQVAAPSDVAVLRTFQN